MKYIKINKDKINSKSITREETRIKVLLINSKNEILLGYSYNCYQFIGGHLEKEESLINCLNREVTEETGMVLNIDSIEPYLLKEEYYKDYPNKNENYNSKIYYFSIKTDLLPDDLNTNYTKEEKIGNFIYKYVKLDEIENTIIKNFEKYEVAKIIGLEMLTAIREYKKQNKFISIKI